MPYTCPTCRRTSHHPDDARHRYCAVCGFEGDGYDAAGPHPLAEPWYGAALRTAMTLHAGQVDKAGAPYWHHLDRVARRLVERFPDATRAQVHAALLHDALEDTPVTPAGLAAFGVPPDVIRTVQLVSRRGALDPALSYLAWIRAIADTGSVDAIRVKLADMGEANASPDLDNSDPARPHPARERMMREKYEPARAILEAALALRPPD